MGDDEASAKAFVRYYFEVFSDALTSGDTATFEALSLARCKTCRDFAGLIRDTYDKGGHYETSGWSVEAAYTLEWTGTRIVFALRTRQKARTLFDQDDKVVHRTKAGLVAMRVILQRRATGWQIERLDVVK